MIQPMLVHLEVDQFVSVVVQRVINWRYDVFLILDYQVQINIVVACDMRLKRVFTTTFEHDSSHRTSAQISAQKMRIGEYLFVS